MPEPTEPAVTPESAQPPDDFAAYEAWVAKKDEPQPEPEVTETPAAVEETAKNPPPESEPEKEDQEHGQKGRGFQRRIDQLTAKIRDLENRLAPVAETKPGIASPQPPVEQKDAQAPKAESYTTYDEYIGALVQHTLKQEREAERQAEQQRTAQTEAQKAQEAWDERKAKVSAQYTDWDEVVGAAAIPVSRALHDALLTSEHGPEIAYNLAKDPAEAKRLFTLSPLEQIRTVGRLEAKFEAAPEPERPKVSRAPKPPTPVTGGVKSSPLDIHDEALNSDYVAWEKVRIAQLRRR